jgi:hypothetical protein
MLRTACATISMDTAKGCLEMIIEFQDPAARQTQLE